MPEASPPVAGFLAALELAGGAGDRFTGRGSAEGSGRVFGGLIVAQALVAAARTVDGRPPHALHAVFLRGGDPGEPFAYAVERMFDGRSYAARRCTASQHGRPVFALTASFHRPEAGAPFDHAPAAPDVFPPEAALDPAPAGLRAFLRRHPEVEIRPAARDGTGDGQAVWMRMAGRLPDAPAVQAGALAYLADITLIDTAFRRHARSAFEAGVQVASLDHAVWFHRPARADAWLLHVQDSPAAAGGRGFARGAVFDRAGRHVASTAQEGLMRPRAASSGSVSD